MRSRQSVSVLEKMSVLRSRKEEEGVKLDTMLAATAILVQMRGANTLPRRLASGRLNPATRPVQMRTELSGDDDNEKRDARVRFSCVSGV